jgi:hypothetical protein
MYLKKQNIHTTIDCLGKSIIISTFDLINQFKATNPA